MATRKYLAIGAAALVAAALVWGGYWWTVENHRRKEAQQRAAQRAKALEEGLKDLRSQTRLDAIASVRKGLDDPTNRHKVGREIPAWDSYRVRLAQCNDLVETLSRGAAQGRRGQLGPTAVQGFTLSTSLFGDVTDAAQKSLDEMSAVLKDDKFSLDQLSQLDRLRWRSEFYNSIMKLLVGYVDDFSLTLRLLAVNSATPQDRLAAFDLAAGAFERSAVRNGAKRLEYVMREAHKAEDDSPTRERMGATLLRLKIPPSAPEPGKKTKT